jgi:hypothetical protein
MRSDGFTPIKSFVLKYRMTLSMSFGRRQNWSMHKCFGVSGIMEMMPPGMSQPPLNEFGRMASI